MLLLWLNFLLLYVSDLLSMLLPMLSKMDSITWLFSLKKETSKCLQGWSSFICLTIYADNWRPSIIRSKYTFPDQFSNSSPKPSPMALCAWMHAKSLQSCPTLCDPMDFSQAGSSVRRILQAGILEWIAIFFSRDSSQPRDQTHVSLCLLHWRADSLPLVPPGKPHLPKTPYPLSGTLLRLLSFVFARKALLFFFSIPKSYSSFRELWISLPIFANTLHLIN